VENNQSLDWDGNMNSIWKTIGASNHTDNEREADDYYATDPIAIDKLLTVEEPNLFIWECACGGGHLSERLSEKGYVVYSTDIKDRGYVKQNYVTDFLKGTTKPFATKFDILTNPPYKYAKEFVLKALELLRDGCKCYMFLKLTFLEGQARYRELFSQYPPKKVYVFSERVMCAKNAEFQKMKNGGGSAVAYGWYVWEKGYKGSTTIEWI
jgi:hypothetical protein